MPVAVKTTKQTTKQTNTVDIVALRADTLAALDAFKANNDDNVKLNQRAAYNIFRYRMTEKTPVAFDKMKADSKALSDWRANMRVLFLGPRPKNADKGAVSQATLTAQDIYDKRAAILNDASLFVVAVGTKGVTSEHYSDTLKCFAVPPSVLLSKGWQPAYDLADVVEEGKMVALDNTAWWAKARNKEGKWQERKLNASLRQVLAVFREKPDTAATDASLPAPPAPMHDPKVVKEVLASSTVGVLARGLRDAFNRDNSIPTRQTDFSADDWSVLMSVAQRIMSIANVHETLEASKKAA